MGFIDEVEAAAADGERPGTRTTRRFGALLVLIGAALCIVAAIGGRWWMFDFFHVRVQVGLSSVEACPGLEAKDWPDPLRKCETDADRELFGWASHKGADGDQDVEALRAWLGDRGDLQTFLFLAIGCALVIALVAIQARPYRRLFVVAVIGAAAIAGLGALPARFAWSAPHDLLERGVHGHLALGGLGAMLAGLALVLLATRPDRVRAQSAAEAQLPTAVARQRR